ncbi:MAG: cyclic nucleotide-binding domain-containing protein [Thermoflexales bacterium]|nr:cyclic nucleotide-binding domain-containing protein [Thermoflexales bacterium]
MAQEAGGANDGPATFTPERALRYLRESTLFARLTDDEFKTIIGLLHARTLGEGEALIVAGGDDTNLYILRRGKLLVRKPDKGGKDPLDRFVQPVAILNELSFVTGHPNVETIEAVTPAQLWYIPRAEFQQLLQRQKHLRERLSYTPEEQQYIKQPRRFDSQRPGELVLWFGRRHWWVLLRRQWLTMLMLLFLGVTFLPPIQSLLSGALGVVPRAALGLVALANFLWCFVDWWNDYYVVTDQRVIHRERILIIYDSQDEAPIHSVQSVKVERSTFADSLLNTGTLTIETLGARANICFDWVSEPDKLAKLILDQQARARLEESAIERAKVRSELRRELNIGTQPAVPNPKADEKGKQSPPLLRRLASALADLRNELLPRVRLARPSGEVVYRKHWLVLVKTTIVPLLFCLSYLAAIAFVWFAEPTARRLLFGMPVVIVVAALGFILLLWLVWQYEDWRNDLYVLAPDRLVDYKRSPFGLLGTKQRTASLANVQNVTAETKGFLDNLLNVGDVIIRTGGVDNELDFARVWNPRGVQREVVNRVEAYRAEQREKEAARRRREFIEWIGIYDELIRIHGRRPLS